MAQVIVAERNFIGGTVWTAAQLAELETINKLLYVTGQIVSGCASNLLLPLITCAQRALVSHRDTLINLIIGRKQKRGISSTNE